MLDLSGKIEPDLVELFRAIENVTAASRFCYFVIGATARDIILHYGYDVPIKRATADTDLGIEISSWHEFQTLKEQLTATGLFTTTGIPYRLIGKCQDIVDSLSGLRLCCLLWDVVSTQLVFKFIHLTLLME